MSQISHTLALIRSFLLLCNTVPRSAAQSYQADAVGAMVQLTKSHFETMHTFRYVLSCVVLLVLMVVSCVLCVALCVVLCVVLIICLFFCLCNFDAILAFRLEWQPGANGYVRWYMDGEFRFGECL